MTRISCTLPKLVTVVIMAVVPCVLVVSMGTAFAQAKGGRGGSIIVVRETTVVGRVQKPVAAQEIGKMPTRLHSSEPKKSFIDRIEGATSGSPF